MGSIPEFITKQLVSSAVGTAGVRRVSLGASVAQAGAQIANIGFKELARKQDMVDTIDAATKIRKFQTEQEEVIKQLEIDFRKNPQEGIKIYKGGITGSIDDFLNEDGVSLNVKGKMVNQINQLASRNIRQMEANAYNQNVVNVTDAVNGEINAAAGRILADPTNDILFAAEVVQIENLVNQSIVLFEAQTGQKFKAAARESMALALTNGLKDKNPLLGLDIIKQGALNNLLPSGKLNSERDALRTSVKGWNTRRKYNNIASLSRLHDDIIKDFLDGTISTVAQVKEAEIAYLDWAKLNDLTPPPEFVRGFKALKKVVQEQMFADAVDNPTVIGEIEEKFQRIKFFQGDDVQYQQAILSFKTDLMEAAAAGNIEQDMWTSYTKRVVIEGAKGVVLETGDVQHRWAINPVSWFKGFEIPPNTPEGFGTGAINSFVDSFNFPNELSKSDSQYTMNKALIKEMFDMERRNEPVTKDVARGIANRLIFKEIQKLNPNLLGEQLGETVFSGGNWFLIDTDENGIIGFKPTKKPKVD